MPYWEDTSSAKVVKTRCIFINFDGGEKTNLPALVRARSYARFLDPSLRLGKLLERCLDVGLVLGEDGFWDGHGIFCEIVGLLLRSRPLNGAVYEIPDTDRATVSDFVLATQAYLKNNLAAHINRESIARHLHISVSTLMRRYSRETGESPMATRAAIRINIARSLLLKGHRLKLIATQTGFCDEYHLSKTFKKLVGVSPREFRK
jgi:AraC-like DNA-binding protein